MTDQQEFGKSDRRVLSRRTVVRTAAHSAWMVPAISLATAVPALAASGGTRPSLSLSAGSGTWTNTGHSGNTYSFDTWVVSGITVTNAASNPTGDTATGISVTISFGSSNFAPSTKIVPTAVSSGWSYDAASSTATSYVFDYTGTNVTVGNATSALGATFGFSGSATRTGSDKSSGEVAGTTAAATVVSSSTAFNSASGSITSTN